MIHMIRHGKPASIWGGTDDDPGLDDVGHQQARAVAKALLALPPGERPTRVISSPLRRCRETAQPFADALGVAVEIDPGVGEIPTPAGLSNEARPAWLRTAFGQRWSEIEGDLDYADWAVGVGAAVAQYEGCAVFSHFVAINAALGCAIDDDRAVVFRPDHTSVTVFQVKDGRLCLLQQGAEAATQVL
ncbi:histidine phosphatase family protein [Caulobacter sp. NIBR2454]|uniref:histidine phosphatase family protein n=1 Tax=Caulobacter sp. NIBR2454 TaxID=3015996 RepID=UPI0022B6C1DE|nr:histidine phosphatase family protein [Caulobacter sp. NIBR2454]